MGNKIIETYRKALATFSEEGRLRSIPNVSDDTLIDLTSNDYLELGHLSYPVTMDSTLFTSSASRLLSTKQKEHTELEMILSRGYHRRTLLFNSGYHANVGCISALASKQTMILADRLVHASIIDGIRLSGAPFRRYRHNDMDHLEQLLEETAGEEMATLIITESIFSMDGDVAPVRRLVELKQKYPDTLLYIDEAHAFGVRGKLGFGVCEEEGVTEDVDIIVGTFGKAAASAGAFVAADREIIDYLINTSRSLIFSTALPPACHIHTARMLEKHIIPDGSKRLRLKEISERFREGIERITGHSTGSQSHIVPLMVGDAHRVIEIAESLRRQGVLALPIRRPTVPPGTERIRFALSTRLSPDDIDYVLRCVDRAWNESLKK